MDRVILHCDMNGFYASVELLDYPQLKDKPMAVCGNPDDRHGIILAKNEIAYRVRTEGERIVAALKWKGHSEGGLHTREEINVPVMDDEPDISVFHESEIGRQLAEIVGDETLECFMETKFNRRRFRIDTGTSIFEVSVDVGRIVTKYGESPISEVEIELFTGETKEMIGIGRKLRDKYDLEAENESKYARGIELIRDNMGDESRNISEAW